MTRGPLHSALEELCFAVMPLRACLRGDKRQHLMDVLQSATRALAGRVSDTPAGRGTPRQVCAIAVHKAALELALSLGVPGNQLTPHFNNRMEAGGGSLSPEQAMEQLRCALTLTAVHHLDAEKDVR
ncbi:hypothetical protein BN1012_Phect2618 [Candidatus Phaeomarinobacter ectocarpi]|uniref:Uncharacterized protein n=1 Tax=Candidatus Phaeomarinibacter ectocarpi TaxID=1458461 RepID=X5MP31_9HYPH|nr:hypothetical protein [Candidatus Phaeomarinobacter ectocarpi]CDO60831.1 hypothetical protein BN1012_Phect2618 [Candidatus Phaeomarinobacter ectocarpi]